MCKISSYNTESTLFISVNYVALTAFCCGHFRYKFIAFPLLSKVEAGPNNCKRILVTAGLNDYEIGKTKASGI